MPLNRYEMNDAFLAFTGACLCLALITLCAIVAIAKCHCRSPLRKRRAGRNSSGAGKAQFNSRAEAVHVEGGELEWIDERNTELVSSTIKVQTLHATNSQLNSLLGSNAK